MAILKDQDGEQVEPLTLTKTKYLPALEGRRWSGPDESRCLTTPQQLLVKRAKLDIKIILRESDESAKFELFQRLNTGGTPLSDQEIRNAMLVAANKSFYDWLVDLADYSPFKDCATLSERAYEERYDVELVLRFVAMRKMDEADLQEIGDIGEFLTEEMMKLSARFRAIKKEEERAFRQTFDVLASVAKADAFRRYDAKRGCFTGGFLISGFEAVALGIGYHTTSPGTPTWSDLMDRIKALWSMEEFTHSSGSGVCVSTCIPAIVKLGRTLFEP